MDLHWSLAIDGRSVSVTVRQFVSPAHLFSITSVVVCVSVVCEVKIRSLPASWWCNMTPGHAWYCYDFHFKTRSVFGKVLVPGVLLIAGIMYCDMYIITNFFTSLMCQYYANYSLSHVVVFHASYHVLSLNLR